MAGDFQPMDPQMNPMTSPGTPPPGSTPMGQEPGQGQTPTLDKDPMESAENPVIAGIRSLVMFTAALDEKQDPRAQELKPLLQQVIQVMQKGSGAAMPGPTPGAPQAPAGPAPAPTPGPGPGAPMPGPMPGPAPAAPMAPPVPPTGTEAPAMPEMAFNPFESEEEAPKPSMAQRGKPKKRTFQPQILT